MEVAERVRQYRGAVRAPVVSLWGSLSAREENRGQRIDGPRQVFEIQRNLPALRT